ncbi:MAG: accessory Sec system protein Asp2 [Staphylococcus rostri]|nr:accessory Sec system protein Asp2 [Staphylococcus rostri]MDO5375193.1 accessory Sec system protein Asp2 [Staphylococcus rostri]
MTLSIATIGSFITNDNFNNTFNPYYQQFFEVIPWDKQVPITNHKVRKIFFKRLKDMQPQYLLLDFSLDIIYGWLLSHKKRILFKNISNKKQAWKKHQNFDNYFEVWKKSVQQLQEFLTRDVPNCRILLVQSHFADTFTDGNSIIHYCKQNNLSTLDIKKMNQQWDTLNTYFMNTYDVTLLDLTKTNYALNKTDMATETDFHLEKQFYNHFLNKLISLTHQIPIINEQDRTTTQRIYLNESFEILKTKQVDVVIGSKDNILKIARAGRKSNSKTYQLYKKLLENDYILYAHENGISKLYQRRYIDEIWKSQIVHKVGDIYYSLEAPKHKEANLAKEDNKLLIIFPSMPMIKHHESPIFTERMFNPVHKHISNYINSNVYIMRIADLNLSYGSHFINTINYSTMEQDITNAIVEVKEKLNFQDKDIILYGPSKGGTGALYYGSKLDLKCLAVDPIIHLGHYNKNDAHFLRGFRKIELSDNINKHLSQGSYHRKYIIASENVAFNFKYSSKIIGDNVIKLNKKDAQTKSHADVSRNTKFEQLMLINQMLSNKNPVATLFYLKGLKKKILYVLGMIYTHKSLHKF